MPTFAPFLDEPPLKVLDEEENTNRPRKWRFDSYNVSPSIPSPPDIPEQAPQDNSALIAPTPTPQPYVDAPPDIPQPEPGEDPVGKLFGNGPSAPSYYRDLAKKHGLTIGVPVTKSKPVQPKPVQPKVDLLDLAKKHGLEIGKPVDPNAAQLPPGMRPRVYPGLQGPPDAPPSDPTDIGMFGGKGVSLDIDPAKVYQQSKHNIGKILSATGGLLGGTPEFGGTPGVVPTDEQIKKAPEALTTPAIALAAGTKPGTVLHGVLSAGESLTSPGNIALMAGTAGLAGADAAALKLLKGGLGTYFTYQMGKGATDNVIAAKEAYDKGDLDTVAEKLGAGSVDGLFAFLGLHSAAKSIYDRVGPEAIDAHNAEADRQFNEQVKRGSTAQAARQTAAKTYEEPIPVKVRVGPPGSPHVDATVEFADVSISGAALGKPAFDVINNATGKTMFSGFPHQVKEWLAERGAEPGELPEGAAEEEQPPATEEQPPVARRQGTLMREFGQDVQPGPSAPESPITPEDLMLLERDPSAIRDPRKRDQLISRQTEVANRLQLWDNQKAAGVDPFAGFEGEVGQSPTKGAGPRPTHSPETLLGPNPDGSYTVRDTVTQEDLFHGNAADAQDFIRERTGADIYTSTTAEDAGVQPGGRAPGVPPRLTPAAAPAPPAPGFWDRLKARIQGDAQPEAPAAEAPAATGTKPAQTEAPEPITKPVPPSKVEKVSPDTPNPPTAAIHTTPESPETIALQLDQLGKGQRKAVMFPPGTNVPPQVPEGSAITNDGLGNIYVYRKDLTSEGEIKTAAKNNTLNEILGDRQFGMGAPDKSAIQGEPITVVVRDAQGNEVQSTATDEANLQTTLTVGDRLKPAGGTVTVEPPQQVLGDRAATTQVEAPPTPVESLESPGDLEGTPDAPIPPVQAVSGEKAPVAEESAAGVSPHTSDSNPSTGETSITPEPEPIQVVPVTPKKKASAKVKAPKPVQLAAETLEAPSDIEQPEPQQQPVETETPPAPEETKAPLVETKAAEPETLAAPEDPETAAYDKAMGHIVDTVHSRLLQGKPIGNVTKLVEIAEHHFGSGRTSGEWSMKDIYDAMEAGVNRYIAETGDVEMQEAYSDRATAENPFPGLNTVRELMKKLTTQGVRTEEQVKFQQFSTPPTQAFLAAVIAHVTKDDVVFEPSAGTGGLAAWAKAAGAEVHLNEVAPRRVKMLELAGMGTATSHDGEIIHSLLDAKVKPTLILMNPPFSAGGLKKEGKNRNQYGFNHVNSALQRLAPNGRLVAILGGGQANQPEGGASLTTGASADWFKKLAQKYNVRANVRISGKEYQKYGTNFATRIIVIDKNGPRDLANVVRGNVDTLEQAYELLRPVGISRPQIEHDARSGSEASAGQNQSGTRVAPSADARGPRRGGGAEEGSGTQEGSELPGRSDQPAGSAGSGETGTGDQSPARVESHTESPGLDASGTPGSPERSAEDANDERPVQQSPVERLELQTTDEDTAPEEESSEAYVTYRPTLKGAAHPGDIVETTTMSTVPLPKITYKPALPQALIDRGGVSAVQLEGIALVGQQNDIVLPDGSRSSALIGDGTGVGKGRESAGILYDNYLQGRKRLVWVSEKWDLQQAAIADFDGMGATELTRGLTKQGNRYVADKGGNPAVIGLNKLTADKKVKHDGVVFSTYALIRSGDKKGNKRAHQLEEYLRGEDDGEGAFILFDESHNLKNAVPADGKPSQIGSAVRELLERIPKLRTASLSATAATDVSNLGYLSRLGLWGPGTPFPQGFRQFQAEVASGGLAAMELIARELKAQGKYLSRTLSFKGVVYSEAEHKLNADQKEIYRTAARAWATVIQRAEQTIKDTTNGGSVARRNLMSQLGGAQQRFFNLLITTLKIPTAVELANKALDDGKAVIITLVNTNEAAQNREKNKMRDRSDEDEEEEREYDFGPKETLKQFVTEHYPIQQWEDAVDDQGKAFKRPAYIEHADGTRTPVINPQAKAERDELLRQIDQDLHLPQNPLDILIDSLGGRNKVAELTGRKEVFDESKNDFVPRGDPNVPRKEYNLVEMANFQGDKKRVAVLSSAAGTGISLHASNRAVNQRQRYHITLQVGWSADKQMQMFGRTHRTDQKQPPEYVMLTSDLGGEKRFISTIARRLGSLGALTKGQKNATSGGAMMDKVNFESAEGRMAAAGFYAALLEDRPVPGTGKSGHEILEDLRMMVGDPERGQRTVPLDDRQNVTRLLNRMLALDPDVQNATYNYYYDIFEATVQAAVEDGTLDTGVRTLPGDSFHFQPARTIATDPKTGAKTQYQQVDAKIRQVKLSVADLKRRIKQHKDDDPVVLINGKTQALAFVTTAAPRVSENGTVTPSVYAATPGKGNAKKVDLASFRNWQPVTEYAAEQKQQLTTQLATAERESRYYQEEIDRRTRMERERLQRDASAKIARGESGLTYADETSRERFQKEIADGQEQLKQAAAHKFPADHYYLTSLKKSQEQVEQAKAAIEAAKPMTNDAENWAFDRWQELYDAAPSHITEEHHFITGAVLGYWNPIREAAQLRNSIFTATDSETGKRLVGIDIPDGNIGQLLQRIEGGGSTVNASQLETDVLRNGLTYTLETGIQVRRGRVGRNPVVQMVPPSQDAGRTLMGMGLVYERGINPVYYVPTNGSRAIIERILDQFPVQADRQLQVETSQQKAPTLSSGRNEEIDLDKTLAFHAARSHFDKTEIANAEDSSRVVAMAANLNGIEFVGRYSGYDPDYAIEKVNGIHVRPEMVPELLTILNDYQDDSLQSLRKAAEEAQNGGKSLVLVKDHALIPKHARIEVLQEELNHALQQTAGPIDHHLNKSVTAFLVSPEGRKAKAALEKHYKKFRSNGHRAFEIGERLMRRAGRPDLELTEAEAATLANLYVKLLGQEYGSKADPIIDRVHQAFESGTIAGGTGQASESAPSGRSRGAESVSETGGDGSTAPERQTDLDVETNVVGKAVSQFTQQTVAPKAADAVRGTRETIDDLVHLIAPRFGTPTATLDQIYKLKGGRDRALHLLGVRLQKWAKTVNKIGQSQQIAFIDNLKTGQPQASQDLQDLADFIRKTDDNLFAQIQKYNPSLSYLADHFRVLWKVVPGSPQAQSGLANMKDALRGPSKRPLQGSKGYMKQHTLADMSDGIAMGGVPVTYNPIKMFMLHYSDAMKYITAQKLWRQFKKVGLRQYVRMGDRNIPPGYVKLDDGIARVWFPVKQGMVSAGEWYVEKHAARLLNNFLSRDLVREKAFGRALLSVKNFTTAMELSLSPFHAVFEASEAVSSQIGIALRELWNLGVRQKDGKAALRSLRTLGTAPAAFATMARTGSMAKRAFEDWANFSASPEGQAWLKQYPTAQDDMKAFFDGGGQMGMSQDYKILAVNGFEQAWNDARAGNPGSYINAGLTAIPSLNELIMKPLFEHYIPNLKMGFFLREYNLGKEEYSDRLASGEMTQLELARKTIDSIENRFGEMNFDNLFWNRTFKTTLQIMFRSVTWKLGNVRANAGAVAQLVKEGKRTAKTGDLPALPASTAWFFGTVLFTMALGGTIYYLSTGKRPRTVKDFVYPPLGKDGTRISIPGYSRDLYHAGHDPKGYAKSGLTGVWENIVDAMQNKDFYGREVYSPDDPMYRQVWDSFWHVAPTPFSFSSFFAAKEAGGSTAARMAGFFGFTKAPRYIEQTDAENLASEYAGEDRRVGARTRAVAEASAAKARIRNMVRRGDREAAQAEVKKDIANGLIQNKDVPTIWRQGREPKLLGMVKSLDLTQQLKVYEKALPEERAQIRQEVQHKVLVNRFKASEWNPTAERLARKHFQTGQAGPRKGSGIPSPSALDQVKELFQ